MRVQKPGRPLTATPRLPAAESRQRVAVHTAPSERAWQHAAMACRCTSACIHTSCSYPAAPVARGLRHGRPTASRPMASITPQPQRLPQTLCPAAATKPPPCATAAPRSHARAALAAAVAAVARSNGAHAPPGLGRCGGPLAASGASPVARAGWRFGALLPHMTARGHVDGCGAVTSFPAPVPAERNRIGGAGRRGGRLVVVAAAATAGGGKWRGAAAGPDGSAAAAHGAAPGSSQLPRNSPSNNRNTSSDSSGSSSGKSYAPSAAELERRLASLRSQLAEAGVDLPEEVASSPGVFLYRTCPVCGGGEGGHDPNTFSMMVAEGACGEWMPGGGMPGGG